MLEELLFLKGVEEFLTLHCQQAIATSPVTSAQQQAQKIRKILER